MATYLLKHRYRDCVIVPFVGISCNIEFFADKDERYVITADRQTAKVVSCDVKNIFDIEDKIQSDYNMTIEAFLKRWHDADNDFQSLQMVILTLQKTTQE